MSCTGRRAECEDLLPRDDPRLGGKYLG